MCDRIQMKRLRNVDQASSDVFGLLDLAVLRASHVVQSTGAALLPF